MHALYVTATVVCWVVAVGWLSRAVEAARKVGGVPNLLDARYAPRGEAAADAAPAVTVIVPARNEAAAIEATLRSLLAQTIPVDIIAVDDRSTDETGAILDRVAAEPMPEGKTLEAIHVTELPAGWMGKTHAMALAARQTATRWLLFTDADILFREDALERALRFAKDAGADHVCLALTPVMKTAGERLMMTVLNCFVRLTFRPWRIGDPRAKDSVGVGGFNLIRSEVYRAVGGFEALRLEVIEDLRLGYEVKRHGFRQRFVFGRDLGLLHRAAGAMGLTHNVTKNFFAAFRFRPAMLLVGAVLLALFLLLPFAGLFGPWPMRVPCLVALAAIAWQHRLAQRFAPIPLGYVLTLPVGAALLLYAMLRSMIVTLARGGVVWRGTFYSLRELRKMAGPLGR